MKTPDVIVAGMPRSGTTWLFNVLKQHPQIFIPKNKEINYFNKTYYYLSNKNLKNPNRKMGWKGYLSYFKNAPKDKKIIDMSILTALDTSSAQEIKEKLPNVKIIFCLRNPVEHEYSLYRLMYTNGEIKGSFQEYVSQRKDLLHHSRYFELLKPFFDKFPKKQIHIIFMKDIKDSPKKTLEDLFNFLNIEKINLKLNVDKNTTDDLKLPQIRRTTKKVSMFLNKLGIVNYFRFLIDTTGIRKIINYIDYKANVKSKGKFKKIPPKTKEYLKRYFEPEINLLEKELKVKVPKQWKK